MIESFKKILLPVDLGANTEVAIQKALQWSDATAAVIHLLHVAKNWPKANVERSAISFGNPPAKKLTGKGNAWSELEQWKNVMEEVKPAARVKIHLVAGPHVQQSIIELAGILNPELIIIAKSSNRKWFSVRKKIAPGLLAEITGAAVLTVKPGAMQESIDSIVIPVRSFIPRRKFDFLLPLVKKRKTKIYLLSLLDKRNELDDSAASNAFIETYRLLKDHVNCQIVHKLVTGQNVAKTILQFAQSVHADVLMVNPEESRISNILDLDICDKLMSNSSLQVLAVDPYSGGVFD